MCFALIWRRTYSKHIETLLKFQYPLMELGACIERMPRKKKETTTIEISIETYDKLHRIKTEIERILECKTSFDGILSVLLMLRDEGIIRLL